MTEEEMNAHEKRVSADLIREVTGYMCKVGVEELAECLAARMPWQWERDAFNAAWKKATARRRVIPASSRGSSHDPR